MDNNAETQSFIAKIGIYIAGVILGLGARLSIINNERKLKAKEIIMHTLVAFASAWIVWYILDFYKTEEWLKSGISVVVGRFGDTVLMLCLKFFKQIVNEKKDLT